MNQPQIKYDAWLHWHISNLCNLGCEYCCAGFNRKHPRNQPILTLTRSLILQLLSRRSRADVGIRAHAANILDNLLLPDRISGQGSKAIVAMLPKSGIRASLAILHQARQEHSTGLAKINIPALMKSLQKTKKTFHITFSGGEPFVIPNIVEGCRQITTGHYIGLTTNLTSHKIEHFCSTISPHRVTNIYASVQIKQMEAHHLTDVFVRNYSLCKEGGFKICNTVVAYPPLASEVSKYKEIFLSKGIELSFIPFFGEFNARSYPGEYTDNELKLFGLETFPEERAGFSHWQGKWCNVGYNVALVSPVGWITPCYAITETLGNIYGSFGFRDTLTVCPKELCRCPLYKFDSFLYSSAIREVIGEWPSQSANAHGSPSKTLPLQPRS